MDAPYFIDAYSLAVSRGFRGTLDQWLESLKGKDGVDGLDGLKGEKGDKGDPGEYAAEQDIMTLYDWNREIEKSIETDRQEILECLPQTLTMLEISEEATTYTKDTLESTCIEKTLERPIENVSSCRAVEIDIDVYGLLLSGADKTSYTGLECGFIDDAGKTYAIESIHQTAPINTTEMKYPYPMRYHVTVMPYSDGASLVCVTGQGYLGGEEKYEASWGHRTIPGTVAGFYICLANLNNHDYLSSGMLVTIRKIL
jgi:hypothetical protein